MNKSQFKIDLDNIDLYVLKVHNELKENDMDYNERMLNTTLIVTLGILLSIIFLTIGSCTAHENSKKYSNQLNLQKIEKEQSVELIKLKQEAVKRGCLILDTTIICK